VVSVALSSCVIFGVDLFLVVLLMIAGGLIAGLARAMGGN